jgi:hypothetical protein
MLLGAVGRATLASFGSPFFGLIAWCLGSCVSMSILRIAGRLIRIRGMIVMELRNNLSTSDGHHQRMSVSVVAVEDLNLLRF